MLNPESIDGRNRLFAPVKLCVIPAVLMLLIQMALAEPAKNPGEDYWEKEILRFEDADRVNPPQKGGVLFVGSSSIRMWDVKKSFPKLNTLNRGFGGSTYADMNRYRERIVFPHTPKMVVAYSGDNDLAGGQTPDQVFEEFKSFAEWMKVKLPETRLIVISIKPSPNRWKLWNKAQETNRLIREYLASVKNAAYVDGGSVLMGSDGLPDKSLFRSDELHLNEAGYAKWTKLIAPLLGESLPSSAEEK